MTRSAILAALLLVACGDNVTPVSPDVWQWHLPSGIPEPFVPVDNPMTPAKVELGRYLFYDTRLSGNGTQSCASCHRQDHAFAGANAVELGSTGTPGRHNAMSLTNVAWNSVQTWANPQLGELEAQALVPMFGESPVELGLAGMQDALVQRISDEPTYGPLFGAAYPDDPAPITIDHIAKAIGSFDRAVVSFRSPYDRFTAGDDSALTDSQKRGLDLFFGERLECHHCHGGFNFTQVYRDVKDPAGFVHYFNNGLYNVDGAGGYPTGDTGIHDLSNDPIDMGRFRPPTLRNIALTAPYMHDGSVATLDDVLTMYARGGRLITSGPNAGDGAASPLKNVLINGFTLSDQDRADVLAFFDALTDTELLTEPDLADPWK